MIYFTDKSGFDLEVIDNTNGDLGGISLQFISTGDLRRYSGKRLNGQFFRFAPRAKYSAMVEHLPVGKQIPHDIEAERIITFPIEFVGPLTVERHLLAEGVEEGGKYLPVQMVFVHDGRVGNGLQQHSFRFVSHELVDPFSLPGQDYLSSPNLNVSLV